MRRFFVENIEADSAGAEITGEEFRHLRDVLRLSPGAEVALFNGKGLELTGTLETVGKESARVKVTGMAEAAQESPLEITLLQAFIKGDGPELIVRKATELGAQEIRFYTTSRTVPNLTGERLDKRLARLGKVAIGAAKQSGRSVVPALGIEGFEEAVKAEYKGLKLMLHNKRERKNIKEVLSGGGGGCGKVTLLIGPEGGLSDDEAARAGAEGFIAVDLGPRILRAGTAAVAALVVVQYELGDMGPVV